VRFEPPVGPGAEPFWDATRQGRLVLPWCTTCGRPFWFPREVCPRCLGDSLEWRDAAGDGTVYAFTVEHRPSPPSSPYDEPYVVALVELAEEVRLMSNIVGCRPSAVSVGMAVQVTWEPLGDGRQLPLFEPATAR